MVVNAATAPVYISEEAILMMSIWESQEADLEKEKAIKPCPAPTRCP